MSRIAAVFNQGHKALIPYVTVGYPSIEATLKVVPLLAQSGADIVELGIPFSDPLADGATIQKASFYALENGVTPQLCLETAKQLSQTIEIPLAFMTYFNPVFSYGLEEFCSACTRSGINGLIIPDLPPEETRRRVALWSEWWRLNQQREEPEWLGQGVEQAIGQLTSDDVYLRAGASRRLERVTGIRFFYRYYMPLKERRTVASLWRRWWKEHRDRFRYADFDSIDQRFRTVDRLYDLEW